MSTHIFINSEVACKFSTSVFASLCFAIEETIEERKIDLPIDVKNLVNRMNLEKYTCPFLDIDDYLVTQAGIRIFLDILEESIYRLRSKLVEKAIDDLWKLHSRLAKYCESLN